MYDQLLDAWAIPRPRELTRAQWGVSNETHFVRSEAGDHVLRLYTNKQQQAIRFEHELLRRLATADLTFRTPLPLQTEAGDTIAIEIESARSAALFRRIPGEHLDDEDVVGVGRAAAAYAALDLALGAIERTDVAASPFSGDLRTVHSAISDLSQLESLGGPEARALADSAAEYAAAIYGSLPVQLVHGDFALGNVLVRAGHVRGVLDFEYAGWNVRAYELAGALGNVLAKGNRAKLWRPVLEGYLGTLALDPAEIAALPALVRLQRAIILVWIAGRTLDGHIARSALAASVDKALVIDEWLKANSTGLVAEALRFSR